MAAVCIVFSPPVAATALLTWAALAAPGLAQAQIVFPSSSTQVPWATGKTAFGHIKSKTGPLDVLASGPSQFPDQVQVWINDGLGNFTAGDALTGNGNAFTLADMNNDGYDDIVVLWSGGVLIWLNNGTGDGSFNAGNPIFYPYGTAGYFPSGEDFQPIRVAAGKTTPGGNAAVIVTGGGSVGLSHVRLFSGNGDGTLALNHVDLVKQYGYAAPDIEFVDVNGNGAPAIVVSAVWGNPVQVFGNDGSGNFSQTFTHPAADQNYFQSGVQFIDMDHDGVLDMVVLTLDITNGVMNTVYWYKGLGNSNFDPTPHTAWAGGPTPGQAFSFGTNLWSPGAYFFMTAADFDGDGQVDLAMGAQLTQPAILQNNGDGTFSPAWAAPLTDSLGHPAFAEFMSYVDVTGTGQESLIGSNYTNNSSQHYTPYGEFYGSPSTTPPDTTPPVITVPGNITAEATGSAGASVTFSASATDAVDGPVLVTCVPASGSTFPLGATSVNCSASDAHNNTATASFTVTVLDTTPPAVTASLTPVRGGGDDESMQQFKVTFSATDAVGVTSLTASLNGVTVTNGQIVSLKVIRSGAQRTRFDDGRLQIQATSFKLTVTAADGAGNTASTTVVPVFNRHGKDNEDHDKG